MKLNRDSWHYRLALLGDSMIKYERSTDFCNYARTVTIGALVGAIVLMIITLTCWTIVDMALWVYVGLRYGWPDPGSGAVAFMLLGLFGLMFGILWGLKVGVAKTPLPEPVIEAYRGWKDKYCPLVEFNGPRS